LEDGDGRLEPEVQPAVLGAEMGEVVRQEQELEVGDFQEDHPQLFERQFHPQTRFHLFLPEDPLVLSFFRSLS